MKYFQTNLVPRQLLIVLLLVSGLYTYSLGQEIRKYDVTVAGISIGEMVAKRSSDQSGTVYDISSKVSFWFFGRINLDYNTVAKFKDNQFFSSEVKSVTNKGNFLSTIRWDNQQYLVRARNYKYELDGTIGRPAFTSSAMLCFEEPSSQSEMMSEAYGILAKIDKRQDHYSVTVNGNTNKYYFENGKLVKAVMEFPIKNYVLRLKD